jgi:hypothetical protein
MDETPLIEYAKLLDEVVDIYRVLTDPRVEPRPDSPGAEELKAAKQQPRPAVAGTWGEEPVREAYALAILNYQVALDHASAIAVLTKGTRSAVSASVLARALVEAASQAWWLLEPDIGHVKRVARSAALRYRSACEGEKAATADGVSADEHPGYTETKAQVEQYANGLGLGDLSVDGSKRWTVYVCDSERLPTASWRVEELFSGIDLPSVYKVFSGYSHGEVFALLRDFELPAQGDLGTHYRSVVNEDSFKGAVAVASYALHPPGERLSRLFGLDNPQG